MSVIWSSLMVGMRSKACSRVKACSCWMSWLVMLKSWSVMCLVFESLMIIILLSWFFAVKVFNLLFSSSLCCLSSLFSFSSCLILFWRSSFSLWSSSFWVDRVSSSCLFWSMSWLRWWICWSLISSFSLRLLMFLSFRVSALSLCLFVFFASFSCFFRSSMVSLSSLFFGVLGVFFPVCRRL